MMAGAEPRDRVPSVTRGTQCSRCARSHRVCQDSSSPSRTPDRADLFTVEVLTLAGLRRYVVCFVIDRKLRRVQSAGIHPQPNGRWREQMARKLTDPVDGFLWTARQPDA